MATLEITGIGVPFRFDNTGYPAGVSTVQLVNDSIFTILSTLIGERVYNPTFGSFLMSFIFEPLTIVTIYRVKAEVRRAIAAWEPRATVVSVDVIIPTAQNPVRIPGIVAPDGGTLYVVVTWAANGGIAGTTAVPVVTNMGA